MKIVWTEEAIAMLLNTLAEDPNITYKEVAMLMTEKFGRLFTKNSCIGKARKLRVSPRPRLPHPFVRPIPHPKKDWPLNIYQLRDGKCKWPLGNVETRPPYMYCGKSTNELGGSYCLEHCKRAYNRTTYDSAKIARPTW